MLDSGSWETVFALQNMNAPSLRLPSALSLGAAWNKQSRVLFQRGRNVVTSFKSNEMSVHLATQQGNSTSPFLRSHKSQGTCLGPGS